MRGIQPAGKCPVSPALEGGIKGHNIMEPHGLSPWYLHKNTLLRPWARSAPAFAKPATAGVGRSVRRHQGFGGLSASGEIRRSSDTPAQH